MSLGTERGSTQSLLTDPSHFWAPPANLPQAKTTPAERRGTEQLLNPCFLRVPRRRNRDIVINRTFTRFLSPRSALPARRSKASTHSPPGSYKTSAPSQGLACTAPHPPGEPRRGLGTGPGSQPPSPSLEGRDEAGTRRQRPLRQSGRLDAPSPLPCPTECPALRRGLTFPPLPADPTASGPGRGTRTAPLRFRRRQQQRRRRSPRSRPHRRRRRNLPCAPRARRGGCTVPSGLCANTSACEERPGAGGDACS